MKYIHVAVNNVSKLVETVSLHNIEGQSVIVFLKNNSFYWFVSAHGIINDDGSHFYNRLFNTLLEKYSVKYIVETPYYLQTSG